MSHNGHNTVRSHATLSTRDDRARDAMRRKRDERDIDFVIISASSILSDFYLERQG